MGRHKKSLEINSPYKLRQRKLKDGRYSLFLDLFDGGKHNYQFLNLYLSNEKTENARRENKKTLKLAGDIIIAKNRDHFIKKAKETFGYKSQTLTLSEFIDSMIEDYKSKGKSGFRNLITAKRNLEKFQKLQKLIDIDREFCYSYFNWLKYECKTSTGRNLNGMTQYVYFKKFGIILTQAYRKGYLKNNLWKQIGLICNQKEPESNKRYISQEELTLLEKTPYPTFPIIREAFLFASFSGLRISDIKELGWSHIKRIGCRVFVTKVMKKTGRLLHVPLTKKSMEFLPKKNEGDYIFQGLPSSSTLLRHLKRWFKESGVKTDDACFHLSRHTYATMLISTGTDLYTTSTLLGHSDIRTTQKYAKVINKKSLEAINKLDSLFS